MEFIYIYLNQYENHTQIKYNTVHFQIYLTSTPSITSTLPGTTSVIFCLYIYECALVRKKVIMYISIPDPTKNLYLQGICE